MPILLWPFPAGTTAAPGPAKAFNKPFIVSPGQLMTIDDAPPPPSSPPQFLPKVTVQKKELEDV